MTNVLILSASASAINCIKALLEDSTLKIFVTDASRYACGLYHAGVTPVVVPPARDLESYRSALDRIIEAHGIEVLIPSSDRDVEAVVELLHRGWNPKPLLFKPPYAAFRILGNKARLMSFLRDKDVTIPATYGSEELPPLPVVVKPTTEGGAKGVHIATSEAAFRGAVERVRRTYGTDIVVQEFVPGGVGSIHMVLMLYDQSGQLIFAVTMRSSLTFMTWGAGGNAGAIVDEPEAIRAARRVIDLAGGWSGPICVEFKRHQANGKFYLLEVNCRLNGYSYLTTMNGLNLPRAMVDLLTTGVTRRLPETQTAGGRNFVLGFREKVVPGWV